MADIDLSEVLASNMLSDNFEVWRRTEGVDSNGRVQATVMARYQTYGVVVPSSPDNLDRGADQQYTSKALSITTPFRLRASTPSYQPDLVYWHGNLFLVVSVGDYTSFGPGFIVATAQSIDRQDYPPQEEYEYVATPYR